MIAVTIVQEFEDCTFKLQVLIENFYNSRIEGLAMRLTLLFSFGALKLVLQSEQGIKPMIKKPTSCENSGDACERTLSVELEDENPIFTISKPTRGV